MARIIHSDFHGRPDRSNKIPPGQSEVIRWPVLTYGPTPHTPVERWTLVIDGEVNQPVTLDWKMFNALPRLKLVTDIHCVTRWSRLNMPWEGVSIDTLVAQAGGLTKKAHFLIATSDGDYTTNLPVIDVLNDQAMVATHAHGEPLSAEHGGPARLFVPHLYLWKSAKWVRRLTFTAQDKPGFWEVNGYHNYGDPWREQRYDSDS
jgi:DMSO/TMAO reductase YedYZ molybdopterin-dependent catalytic subunit